MAKFPREGSTRFPPETSWVYVVHRAARVLYGQLALLEAAAAMPDAMRRFLEAFEGKPETLHLRVLELSSGAGDGWDRFVFTDEDPATALAPIRALYEHGELSEDERAAVFISAVAVQRRIYARLVGKPVDDLAWWQEVRGRLARPIGVTGLPETYAGYRVHLAASRTATAASKRERDVALDAWLRLPGFPVPLKYRWMMPLVRLALVELMRGDVREALGLQDAHTATRAAVARRMFAVSRFAHRLGWRHPLGLVDFAGLAETARRAARQGR